jgi:hypothetical protein
MSLKTGLIYPLINLTSYFISVFLLSGKRFNLGSEITRSVIRYDESHLSHCAATFKINERDNNAVEKSNYMVGHAFLDHRLQ